MSNIPMINRAGGAADFLKKNKVSRVEAGGSFMRFDGRQTGDWLYGKDLEPVTGETAFLNVSSLKHGYLLWHKSKADRRLVPINQEKPEPQEPIYWTNDRGREEVDEAVEARFFEAAFADGTTWTYEASSLSAVAAIDNLLAELFQRAAVDSPYLYPEVELATDSYQHSSYGKIHTPVLRPVAWYDAEGNKEGAEPEKVEHQPDTEARSPEPTDGPKPTKRRTRQRPAVA